MRISIAIAMLLGATGASLAADLPVYQEPAPYIAAAAFSWTGFYVGVDGSYGITRSDASADIDIDEEEGPDESIGITVADWWGDGGLIGAHAGYQYQFGSFVLGAELAAHFSGMSGEDRITVNGPGFNATAFLDTDVNWLATARLKAGWAIDRALIYAIGGLAAADVENGVGASISAGGGGDSRRWSDSDTQIGWTLGAGIEYAITDNWILGLEYQHVEFGDQTVTVTEDDVRVPVDFDNSADLVTAKLSYKF